MTRSEDDRWDITEGVGATALGVAWSRSEESASRCPLFTDPFAHLFLDAAAERGWQPPGGVMRERLRHIAGYAASRTKWFDEFFIAAGANGIEQAVILAAGLDSRAWRLPWISETVVYEIDQPKVLKFKAETLRAHDVRPAARYVAVPADLRQDWPQVLLDNGFDPEMPTAWSAEGLLPYLPAAAQDTLFEHIHRLSARGSRVAVESFGPGFFDEDYLASRREQLRLLREQTGESDDEALAVQDLWYVEDREDVAEWLARNCWDVSTIGAAELMERYGRAPEQADDAMPRTVFVEGQLTG